MAFHLISSNKVETLTEQLAQSLQEKPLSSAFTAEVIVVPSMPMQRWLGLQLAAMTGINCHNEFPLPASWLWHVVSSSLEQAVQTDPLCKLQAAWKIFNLLPEQLKYASFEPLKKYLEHDEDGIKRWQLSERIADVFDRYQYYRPDMIRAWSRGEGQDWQAHLWRGLLKIIGHQQHRVAMIDQFMLRLKAGEVNKLPERVSIFAVSTLPPLLLNVIQAMAEFTDIYMYYLIPTNNYWADLQSDKAMAKQRLEHPDDVVYLETGHELLASWGRQGQVFQDLLLSADALHSQEFECYQQDWSDSLLHQLQQDIFNISMPKHDFKADDSLQVHVCHSELRECQVLHDEILHRLNHDASLKAEDILVMIPDISRYAPYIEAVFSKDEARPFIPWNLSDISIVDEHPVIASFLKLLELPKSRFLFSEVLSLLDVPEILARFDLNADQLLIIRSTLESLNVRWGVDGEHKQSFQLPGTIENSWKQAELRLMAGYAMGDSPLWQSIAPFAIDDQQAAVMNQFWCLFETLNYWRQRLNQTTEQQASAWQSLLLDMMDDLFIEGDETVGRLQFIRDAIADIVQYADEHVMSLELLRYYLSHALAEHDVVGHYFSGGVSFCGMRPMRSLPFRVICLLGMDDTAFPSREKPLEFDCMFEHWYPGDPAKGEMDRYLMLETLLCAREALHISYIGRNLHDNSACQPSVLLGELLDQLESQYGQDCVQNITHLHPMQAFLASHKLGFGYDHYWCTLANHIAQKHASESMLNWPTEVLDSAVNQADDIELRRLIQFVVHPIKYFVNHQLNIYFHDEDELCDDEPFDLDGLSSWQLRKRMLDDILMHGEADFTRMKAEGLLPHAGLADQCISPLLQELEPMQEQLLDYTGVHSTPQAIKIIGNIENNTGFSLTGVIQHFYAGTGLLHLTASKASSKVMMPFWLEHLALCATSQLKGAEKSMLICRDEQLCFNTMPANEALDILKIYITAYRQGVHVPLAIFPKSSWLQAQDKSPKSVWEGNPYNHIKGDKDDDYVQFIMRGHETCPIEEASFMHWAKCFYTPFFQARG